MERDALTVGVEEEFIVIDPKTGRLRPKADDVLRSGTDDGDGHVQAEFQLSQLETSTDVCTTLGEVRDELVRLRRRLIGAAGRAGYRVGATGTHPFSHWSEDRVTPTNRYLAIAHDYQQLARERTVCGCHVHVGMPDPEATVQVMNRTRPWLPALLALSTNSPFWTAADTGYQSFRTIVAHRAPLSGIPEVFASRHDYDRLVDRFVGTGAIEDATRLMWDVRPSARFPTLEFRISDVCLTVDEAVMVAGLARGLGRACLTAWRGRGRVPDAHPQMLRLAAWQAARYGAAGELIDPLSARPVPARRAVDSLLVLVRPALEDTGDWDEVSGLVDQTLRRGTGADRQRRAFERRGRLEDTVDVIVAETATAG